MELSAADWSTRMLGVNPVVVISGAPVAAILGNDDEDTAVESVDAVETLDRLSLVLEMELDLDFRPRSLRKKPGFLAGDPESPLDVRSVCLDGLAIESSGSCKITYSNWTIYFSEQRSPPK